MYKVLIHNHHSHWLKLYVLHCTNKDSSPQDLCTIAFALHQTHKIPIKGFQCIFVNIR